MKRKVKIGKWVLIYSLFCLIIFIALLIVATKYIRHNTLALKFVNHPDLNYQSVNMNNESGIIIWNSKLSDECMIRVDAEKQSFEILEDVYYDNQIYFQYQYMKNDKLVYGIGRVNVSSGKVALYDIKGMNNYKWNSIGIRDGKLYILMNDNFNRVIKEFKITLDNGIICEKAKEITYPDGNVIIKSKYHNGNISVCLDDGNTYYYNDTEIINFENFEKSPFGRELIYEIDNEAAQILGKEIFFDLLKNKVVIFSLSAIIIGLCISIIFGRKTFISKMFICTELLVIAVVVIALSSINNNTKNKTSKYVEKNGISILKHVSEKVNASGEISYNDLFEVMNNSVVRFEEVLVLENTSENVIVKGGLLTPKNVIVSGDGYFGKDFSNLINESVKDEDVKRISKGSKDFSVIIINDRKDINSDRLIIGFINNTLFKEYTEKVVNDVAKRIVGLTLLCNVVAILIYVICIVRFRRFSNALLTLVKNHDKYEKLKTKPIGLKKEWNALDEVKRILSNVSYEKVQRLDMYNRFVPKDFEKLMNRKSLLDVELGDSADIIGSMVTINLDEDFLNSDVYLKTAGNVFKIINSAEHKQNGVTINEDSRLIDTKILFKDDVNSAIDFAIEVMNGFDNDINIVNREKIVVVNYSNFKCGATGSEDRIIPYFYSIEENIIKNYIEPLRRANVKIILTESAVEKSNNKYKVRYIGYITENNKNIKLYECIDAYSTMKKELLIDTQSKFKKALGLFYSNDFYLARNTFNEVLKVNPDDKIARWYLFNCEHNLNNSSDNEISYGLFENRVYEQLYQIK